MEYKDYYRILGLPRTATQADIKKAYRKLARQHHPDRNQGDDAAERRFKDVNEAHEVLSDPEKRERYDVLGADWEAYSRAAGAGAAGRGAPDPFGPGGPFAAYAATGPGGGVRYEFHTTGDAGEFSDFFQAFFGGAAAGAAAAGGRTARATRGSAAGSQGLEDILAGLGLDGARATATGGHGGRQRGGGTRTATRERGAHEGEAEISLEEAFEGTTRLVEVAGRRLEVTIPPGVATGSRVRLSGQGPGGSDVVVVVRVRPHPAFTRHGNDLERELPLTLEEALLGAEVPVGTLTGRVILSIAPGTQGGQRIRLAGKGMPALKGGARGDLYVRTRIVLPTRLSDEAKVAAERFLALVHQPDPRH